MTAPTVRYCTTEDGVRIAYTMTGSGPPLVLLSEIVASHVELEWSNPVFKRAYGTLAEHVTLIRFNERWSGLSDRSAGKPDPPYLDIQAVKDKIGVERFALAAIQSSVPLAIMFAADYPDTISHLILIDGHLRSADFYNTPPVRALMAAAAADYTVGTEAVGATVFGVGREESREYGAFIRKCVDQEFFVDTDRRNFDATKHAPRVTAPTLILMHSALEYVTGEMTRDLAAAIPDSEVATLERSWLDRGWAIARILEFLNVVSQDSGHSRPESASGMTAILFADIADSTALTERLGDDAFRAKARQLDGALRAVIRENGGTPIEGRLLGDGVLAVFTSARRAIEAALACGRSGDEAGLPLHLGLHAGDVTREEDPDGRGNVYGGAVNIAARISALAAPGEVLVSQTVRDLARTSAGVAFEERGERELKGVSEPVRVWTVRGHGEPRDSSV